MAFELKNKEEIKQLYTLPKKELEYPHLKILSPNVFHEIDILYLPNDNGYKYLLTIIDVHNSLCDARALKTMKMDDIIHSLDNIYDEQMYLTYPKLLQSDNQFDNSEMKQWCHSHNIKLKITEAYRSRQNAHVERLNQSLAYFLWRGQIDREITTKKDNTEWRKYYREIIDYLNQKRLKGLDKDLRRKNLNDNYKPPILNKNNNYIIEKGTQVRLMLDAPVDMFNRKLQGDFRKTDIRWKRKPVYEVVEFYIMPNSPILYSLKDTENNRILKAMFTAEQLQIINQKQE